MYYSAIGTLAILILLIENQDILRDAGDTFVTPAWKVYRRFADAGEGIRCMLRSEMLRVYYHNREAEQIRQYEAENFEHNYKAYVALGGNSFIGNVHKEVTQWEIVS